MGKIKNKKAANYGSLENKIAVAKAVVEDYAKTFDTIENCCMANNVPYRTFMSWADSHAEIADIYNKSKTAKDLNYKKALRDKAKSSLFRAVEGYEVEEVQTIGKQQKIGVDKEGDPVYKFVVSQQTKTKKYIQPNPTLIIFALTNTNDEEDTGFTHRNQQESKVKIEGIDLTKLSDDDLDSLVKISKKVL